jgi:hypothetical protein
MPGARTTRSRTGARTNAPVHVAFCHFESTTEADDPGSYDAATISRFNASGRKRLRRRPGAIVSTSELMDTVHPQLATDHTSFTQTRPIRKTAPSGGIHGARQWQT